MAKIFVVKLGFWELSARWLINKSLKNLGIIIIILIMAEMVKVLWYMTISKTTFLKNKWDLLVPTMYKPYNGEIFKIRA